MAGALGALAVYALGLAGGLAGLSVLPGAASRLAEGVAGYYAVYLALLAAVAAASWLTWRRLVGGGACASPAWCAAVAAASLGGFMGLAAVVGFRPTGISGVVGAALAASIYALRVAPLAAGVAALPREAWYSPLLAAAAGVAALDPAALASWPPGPGAAAVLAVGSLLGYAAYKASGALGPGGALAALAGVGVAAGALPYTVSGGAAGFALAGLAGAYAGLAVAEAAGAGGGDGSWPLEPRGPEGRRPGGGDGGGVPGWLILAVAVAAGVAVAAAALAAQGVMVWRPLVILTGSMEPTLSPGDLVLLQRVDDVRVGDVIAFRADSGVVVVHRVIDEVAPGVYKTKGDANDAPDPYNVTRDMILGRVWARIPGAGWPVILVNWNNATRLAALAAAAALVAGIARK